MSDVGSISDANGDDESIHLVDQGPIQQLIGDELLVGDDQLLPVPVLDGGGASLDLQDPAGDVSDRHDIAGPQRPLEQQDQPRNKVGKDLLESEAESDANRGDQPLDP